MRKVIFFFILFVIIIVLTSLVFDWGRNDAIAPVVDNSFIKVNLPTENQELKSPIKISGQARGTWFFEGSFPIQLVDTDGNILVSSFATSTEDWMTENFIPFSATLEFVKPTSTKHVLLILKKDNPSGLAEHDDSISIPLILK